MCETDFVLAVVQTNGMSNGLIPMLRVYNNTARYVDQGGNKVSIISLSHRTQQHHHLSSNIITSTDKLPKLGPKRTHCWIIIFLEKKV